MWGFQTWMMAVKVKNINIKNCYRKFLWYQTTYIIQYDLWCIWYIFCRIRNVSRKVLRKKNLSIGICLLEFVFWSPIFAPDSCNVDCVRERMKHKLQSAMRTLRKSINKQQFYIQFSGTEYEVAQKPSKVPEGAEACSTGQILRDGKCGKFEVWLVVSWCHHE